jgi:hypothetical protein
MVDKNVLRHMSQEVLVIPFSDETAETLDRFCDSQVENISRGKIDELIMAFVTRINNEELKAGLESFLESNNVSTSMATSSMLPVLEEYIVLKAIEQCEDGEEKALYSLLLKNALVLAVKGDGFVAMPEKLTNVFNCYSDFLALNKVFDEEDEDNEVIGGLLDAADDSFTDKLSEVDKGVLRAIVYDAALHRHARFIDALMLDADNPLLSIYLLAKRLVDDSVWKYIDQNMAATLKKLLGEYRETSITLKEMRASVKEAVGENDEEFRATSVLLRLLSGNDEDIELSEDTVFRADELALYLYYEFLAERMAFEMNESNV